MNTEGAKDVVGALQRLVTEYGKDRARIRALEQQLAEERALTQKLREERALIERIVFAGAPPPPGPGPRADIVGEFEVDGESDAESHAPKRPADKPCVCPKCAHGFGNRGALGRHLSTCAGTGAARLPRSASAPAELVGRRVSIWWAGDETWYEGLVRSGSGGNKYAVLYDDGELAEEELAPATQDAIQGWRLV